MKSIIEEASSISKAIENAWIRANKPKEFKIRVFEEPERNMFGMTTKSAKIAFYFNELQRPDFQRESKPERPEHEKQKIKNLVEQQPEKKVQAPAPQPSNQLKSKKKQRERVGWSDEMKKLSEEWIKKNLSLMNRSTSFKTETRGNNLYVTFEGPVLENEQKERILFSSFAHLIMAMLGNNFKKKYTNLKVVLTRA